MRTSDNCSTGQGSSVMRRSTRYALRDIKGHEHKSRGDRLATQIEPYALGPQQRRALMTAFKNARLLVARRGLPRSKQYAAHGRGGRSAPRAHSWTPAARRAGGGVVPPTVPITIIGQREPVAASPARWARRDR